MLLGLDLGAELTGYCVGIGDSIPTAGAWRFSPAGDDLGALGDALYRALDGLTTLYPVTRIVYEAPILLRRDKLLTLRKLYGLGMVLETWAKQVAVPCHEASVAALKRELAGRARVQFPENGGSGANKGRPHELGQQSRAAH